MSHKCCECACHLSTISLMAADGTNLVVEQRTEDIFVFIRMGLTSELFRHKDMRRLYDWLRVRFE